MSDATTADVTLIIDLPLPRRILIGADIAFEGVAMKFTPDPFMLTFNVETRKLKLVRPEKFTVTRSPPAVKP
jgi:hypothetical protein